MKHLLRTLKESAFSVLPIAAIVLILSVSLAPLNAGVLVLFLFGTLLLIFGMSFFTIGSGISMEPLGESIGIKIGKARRIWVPLVICFILGVLITVSEPDLQVLAEQVPSIPNMVLILCVALGVGLFLSVALFRARKSIQLPRFLIFFYLVIIALSFFVPEDFIPTAFDSGGVTTGPITVPFIMALGAGMSSMSKSKHSVENSFGFVSLCSIGPILSVLILSICFKPKSETSESIIPVVETTKDAFLQFINFIPKYAEEVAVAFLPIVAMFIVFQLFTRRFLKHEVLRISVGFIYTYIGLVLFLTGANVGFMPAGKLLGSAIAESDLKYLLVPIGLIIGYFVVSAEPAVNSLKKQVSEITNGAISQKAIGLALSIGVGTSVAIALLRVLTGIPILPFLIVGYSVALIISFFVPPIYTAIAFDSGGVASGPMATTFILPFAVGSCEILGGNIMTDAFGIVAMIALAPLITIQVLGLSSKVHKKIRMKRVFEEFQLIDDDIIYFNEVSDNE